MSRFTLVAIPNLMDPEITAKEIVIHYHKRWDIEIAYDEIKTWWQRHLGEGPNGATCRMAGVNESG